MKVEMNKLERFILSELIESLPDFKGVRVCSPSNLVHVLLEGGYNLAHKLVNLSEYVANHKEGFTITDEAINTITKEWKEAMNNESNNGY